MVRPFWLPIFLLCLGAPATAQTAPSAERASVQRAIEAGNAAYIAAFKQAITLAPEPLNVPDQNLQLHTAAELKTELEQGTERTWGDINPLKVMRQRK